jgi:hypothetical protein
MSGRFPFSALGAVRLTSTTLAAAATAHTAVLQPFESIFEKDLDRRTRHVAVI